MKSNYLKRGKGWLTGIGAVLLAAVVLGAIFAWGSRYSFRIEDGNHIRFVTLNSRDPQLALERSGTFLRRADTYTVEKSEEGWVIRVCRRQQITLVLDGREEQVFSLGETVEQLLDRLQVDTRGRRLSHSLQAQTFHGMVLRADTVERRAQEVETAVPYGTVYCYDPSLPEGEQQMLFPGKEGVRLYQTQGLYVNGRREGITVLDSREAVPPTHQVVAVGTGERVGQARQFPLVGENVLVTEEGEYLYFSHSDHYEATAYTSWVADVTGTTACGTPARVGAVAVDPRVIPYFTRMYIVSRDGTVDYGIASAEDCGGAVKGKVIDLFFDTLEQCCQFGRRDIIVYFLTEEPV